MSFLQDHLVALIVGAVVMIGLPFLTLRSGESTRSATQAYMARDHVLSFVDVVNQDLANVGAEVPMSLPAVVVWTPGAAGLPTAVFEFRGAVDPVPDALVSQVRYEVRPVGTAEVRVGAAVDTVPTYQVVRSLWDGAAYVAAGASPPILTAFEATLTRGGVALLPTDDLETADALELRVEAAVASDKTVALQLARWHSRHTLMNLGAAPATTP